VDVARRALRPRREHDLGPPPVLLVARHGQDRERSPVTGFSSTSPTAATAVGASRYRSGEATELEGGPLPKQSAGILLYRVRQGAVEVLLVHPGGPFWAKKDLGAWSIPKGEYQQGEDPLAVALREFEEETGHRPSRERPLELGAIRQRGGKVLSAWALAGDLDADATTSNTFTLEWPPRSGRQREFPEVDRAGWFDPATAREKLNPAQAELVDRLLATLAEQPERGR
jgi:predicted NUDIX family NTP pyrophosphohydrolase